FPSALYLPETMQVFEEERLFTLKDQYPDKDELIRDVAAIHAELLFIHPFREGNGRIARILADAMAIKYGAPLWKFEMITEERMESYILAVQSAAEKDYMPMEKLFRTLL